MKITRYRFGEIEIDGRTYIADVIITPERVLDAWRRQEGHNLTVDDLAEIVAARPETLVVGTGFHGRMTIPGETRRYLEVQGIVLRAADTADAVKAFNRLQRKPARVVAALHLTC